MMETTDRKQQIVRISTLVFTFIVVPLVILLLTLVLPASAETAQHYTDLKLAPAPDVKVPDYSRFELKNGMIVYLMEDHELPLVSGTALIRTGDRFEPGSKVGLAGLTGAVMRSGGTQTHSPRGTESIIRATSRLDRDGHRQHIGKCQLRRAQ